MYSERGDYTSRVDGLGRSTCRVKVRRKRPRLLEARDHHNIWHSNSQPRCRLLPAHDARNALANTEKEKKYLYLQACLDRRSTFTLMVYSAYRIPGAEALAIERRLYALLSYKLKREYSEMCGFVRVGISLVIVRSNSLLLRGPRNNEVRIWQRPELTDGAVMALLAPWQG